MQLNDLVQKNLDRMSENDNRIWRYISCHRRECREMSLRQLAEACEVSHATVLRFLHLIGLDGYHELKTLLKWDNQGSPVVDSRMIEKNSFDLTRTIHFIQQTDCAELFEKMDQAEGLYAYGTGSVQKAAARVLKDYLIVTERLLHVIEGKEERVMAMRQMKKGDVVFLLSVSGNNPVMNEYAAELKDQGMVLVAICQDGANDLSKLSHFSFPFFTQKLDVGRYGLSYYSSSGLFIVIETIALKYVAYQAVKQGEN